jgi:rubrerythrin
MPIPRQQLHELLLQSLEAELGGVQVYESALECALNDDLRDEWRHFLEETERHVEVVQSLCAACGVDPETETPGRRVVRRLCEALVAAIASARDSGTPEGAQIVAAECIVLAEHKDHLDWELIGRVAEHLEGAEAEALRLAYAEIEDDEDEHLYCTKSWLRELWIASLGLPAVLPPPEDGDRVESASGAARAALSRNGLLKKRGRSRDH